MSNDPTGNAGPDFTREKLIDAINAMTDYDAGGLLPGTDWTTAHEDDPDCYAMMKVVNGKFEPVFGEPGTPFICFPEGSRHHRRELKRH